MAKSSDALRLLEGMLGRGKRMRQVAARATVNAEVAQLIYSARRRAGMTQAQLARLVGTSQPVIARLEDADYGGHSLTMLQRIATALDRRVVLRLTPRRPVRRKKRAA